MRKDAPIISCFHLAVEAGGDNPEKLVDDVTFEVLSGSWNEIIGSSGAGKSLLFGILSLRYQPACGKLVIDGRNFDRLSKRGIAKLRRSVASCGQSPLLLEDRTLLENLVLPFVVRGEGAKAVEVCEALLEEAQLVARRDVLAEDLCEEERLLIGVFRAVAGEPRVLLLDGVLEQLSEPRQRLVMRLLQQRHLAGGTVIVFGREESQNSRRGHVFRMEEGMLEPVSEPKPHERVPETTGRVA